MIVIEFEKISLLHIGLPKTATSFLQREVFPNLDIKYISNEHLSGETILERYTMLRGLRYYYGDVKVLIGVRNIDGLKKSLYSESVKNGNFHSYKYWLLHIIEQSMFDLDSYIYEVKKVFSNVYIYTFEDFITDEESTVNNILRFIGTDYQYKSKPFNKLYNTKLNRFEILLFRVVNFLTEGYKYIFAHHSRTYKGWIKDKIKRIG